MITAEVSIVPVGEGTSVSRHVKEFINLLRDSGLKVLPGPLGTSMEAENIAELFNAIEKAHNGMFSKGLKRLITNIKIDDRRDIESTIEYKLKAIE